MPQLMPMMWVSSSIMIFLLVMMLLNIFYMKENGLSELGFEKLNNNFYMKW